MQEPKIVIKKVDLISKPSKEPPKKKRKVVLSVDPLLADLSGKLTI